LLGNGSIKIPLPLLGNGSVTRKIRDYFFPELLVFIFVKQREEYVMSLKDGATFKKHLQT
jgi:hypothetical protein